MKTIEYKVRPVMRYVVTRYEAEDRMAASTTCGEFDREDDALRVGFALAKNDLHHFCGSGGEQEAEVKFPDFPDGWSYYPKK